MLQYFRWHLRQESLLHRRLEGSRQREVNLGGESPSIGGWANPLQKKIVGLNQKQGEEKT